MIKILKKAIKEPRLFMAFAKDAVLLGPLAAFRKAKYYRSSSVRTIANTARFNYKSCKMPKLDDLSFVQKNNLGDVAFTIISKNYMHVALTLRKSFLSNNPGHKFFIWIVDRVTDKNEIILMQELLAQGVEIVFWPCLQAEFEDYDFDKMLFQYTIMEMNTAIKPFIMEHYIKKGYNKIYYFDPDIYFYKSISEMSELLEEHEILLTPHIQKPYEDNKLPGEKQIIASGIYNLGFIAIKASLNTLKLCTWWKHKLYNDCYSDHEGGLFVDQKWIDIVPMFFEKVKIIKALGYNVAYWNLHERYIESKNNEYYVNDDPLVFFHFSGFEYDNVQSVSKHQNRFKLEDLSSHYQDIYTNYKNELKNSNINNYRALKYSYQYIFGSDIKMPDFFRKTDVESFFTEFGRPFALNLMLESKTRKKVYELLLDSYWEYRPCAAEVFPDIKENKTTYKKYRAWLSSLNKKGELFDKTNLPRKKLWPQKRQFGVSCIGYFQTLSGVGGVGRKFFNHIVNSGFCANVVSIDSEGLRKIADSELNTYLRFFTSNRLYNNQIYFINADSINPVLNYVDSEYCTAGTNKIGVFWWEFNDHFYFKEALQQVDHIIVFSDFIRSAVEKAGGGKIKVTKFGYPIRELNFSLSSSFCERYRKLNNIAIGDIVYYFNFDMYSCFDRKNPLGLLKAFKILSEEYKNTKLILKISNNEAFPDEFNALKTAIKEHDLADNVIVDINVYIENDLFSLMSIANCYVSLHRSEGLGLGIIEAIQLGLPVIATNFGGNIEYMDSANHYFVDYRPAFVKKDFGPYRKGFKWADPDIEHAASFMKQVASAPDHARSAGLKGRINLLKKYSVEKIQNDLYAFARNEFI